MARAAVTAADLHRRIAERSARVGIIGQGYVGLRSPSSSGASASP